MHGRSLALAVLLLLAACGEDDPGPASGEDATGGAAAASGATMATGGLATATGGATGTGATTSGGLASGGLAGGGPGSGGGLTGGTNAGGFPGSGGAEAGGVSTGGVSNTGGASTGGSPTGGFAGAGGWPPTGGVSTGGSPTSGFAGAGGWPPTGGVISGGFAGAGGTGAGSASEGGLADTGGTETGGASDGGAAGATSACPEEGHVSYTLDRAPNPTADQESAYAAITAAMDHAVDYYNCYTNIEKELFVSYNPDVQTADGNVNGSIRFGSRASMQFVTAAHEIAHTVGIGYYGFADMAPDDTKIWTGPIAVAKLREITGDPSAVLYADNTHFWPYGLNYEREYESETDLINHCLMVVAIRADLGL